MSAHTTALNIKQLITPPSQSLDLYYLTHIPRHSLQFNLPIPSPYSSPDASKYGPFLSPLANIPCTKFVLHHAHTELLFAHWHSDDFKAKLALMGTPVDDMSRADSEALLQGRSRWDWAEFRTFQDSVEDGLLALNPVFATSFDSQVYSDRLFAILAYSAMKTLQKEVLEYELAWYELESRLSPGVADTAKEAVVGVLGGVARVVMASIGSLFGYSAAESRAEVPRGRSPPPLIFSKTVA